MWPDIRIVRLAILLFLLFGFAPKTHADITVILEEPYSYDGAFAGTGHTAVYLSRVCATSPIVLRRCGSGERGVVISRYTRVGGYDWIAIPMIPYFYAVEKPENVPLYADNKLVAFLRDQYRRSNLENIVPDGPAGETPKGDWIQLIGSSYDRTSYGFQIETTAEQDNSLIEWLNSRPNRASYRVVSRNCADFVREVVNFYYPKALSRGFITDLFVTTPKHDAKSLIKYTNRHPDIYFLRIVFPQVPGTMKRSRPVRGVLESVFRAKKYMLPLALFHPFVVGGVTAVYLLGDRFKASRNAMVFDMNGDPAVPVTNEERKIYLKKLKAIMAANGEEGAGQDGISWRTFEESADLQMDASGRPVLEAPIGGQIVETGITWGDIAGEDAPTKLQRELIEARLRQQLSRGRAPQISSKELREDWQLLQGINAAEEKEISGGEDRGNLELENKSE